MEQNLSWVTKRSQQIPRILWNRKHYNCVHNSQTHVSILSRINPVHAPSSQFLTGKEVHAGLWGMGET